MSAVNDPPPTINEASEDVETNNEVGATASEFETFVGNGLDGLREQYLLEQDGDGDDNGDSGFDLYGNGGSGFDLDGNGDNDSGSDIDGDGEGDSGCDLDGDDDDNVDSGCDLDGGGGDSGSDLDGDGDSGCDLDGDSDGYGHDRRGSSPVPWRWIIPGAEKYSTQNINNNDPSTTNGHFYKVGHQSEWDVPEEISSIVVEAPPWLSQAG
ncbi:hypothetical protein LWI29_037781 [Acer saccharum]|uniref:Uncharacterized protein n=1 Tax=Acer saccharum TaxID=4024 RepID=A0AA39S5L6_ACESA|nr:hypothetical protein LWI29_037781 [Acer saccharum]